MSYYCKSPRDHGCTLWDFGKVNPLCAELKCFDLVEVYDFRTCDCGAKDPQLYGTGLAKQYIKNKNEEGNLFFTEFDGYIVECSECDAITGYHKTPEEAVEAWNTKSLVYT